MSHAASPEEVLHRSHRIHHPNHRHAVPLRPILHRRATTSHLGRQAPARNQCAHLLSRQCCQVAYFGFQPVSDYRCEGIPMPQGVATIDTPVSLQRYLKQGSAYGSMNGMAILTPTRPCARLTPGASGSAQQSARETQRTISIFNTSPPICRRHVTFQGPHIPNNNNFYNKKICTHLFPPILNLNDNLHRATPNLFLPPISQ